MTDPTFEIRQHYLILLGGISVPVGNIFQATTAPPFVVVNTRANYAGTKDSWEWNVTTTFDIVIKTSGDWGGDEAAEQIANEIVPLIIAGRPDYPNTPNFKIVTCNVTASDPFLEQIGMGKVIRKVLQVENYVSLIPPAVDPSCPLNSVLESVICN